jgi:hypothetical protein
MFNNSLSENRAIYEIMLKNIISFYLFLIGSKETGFTSEC